MPYTIKQLDPSTWDAFAELVERNNGVYGGCWCIGYHPECGPKGISHRAVKEDRVRTGRAHAALVLDEDGAAQGWCQYGSPEELSNIKHKREYDKDPPPLPDWRITCIFVDKRHRGQGIARAGLEGALDQIARLGGGLVEAIPEVTAGREAHGRFLFSATVELFEQYDFTRGRRVGNREQAGRIAVSVYSPETSRRFRAASDQSAPLEAEARPALVRSRGCPPPPLHAWTSPRRQVDECSTTPGDQDTMLYCDRAALLYVL